MKLSGALTLFALAAASFAALPSLAQNPKPQTNPTLGTPQLPGDNGKLKTIYQLGEKGSELHFTLDSAAVALHYAAPDDMFIAGKGQRLLILNFTVQNPQTKEMKLGAKSFAFTAVSPDDENYEFNGYLLHGTKKTHLDQSLKPAQKVKCIVVFAIHESGPINKLMVQRGNAPLVRYDLTGKTDKMTSVFSTDGIDAKSNGGQIMVGHGFDMKGFGIKLTAIVPETGKIKGYEPYKDYTYIVLTFQFTNKLERPNQVGFQYFTPELKDSSGQVISWNRDFLAPSADETMAQAVAPGEMIHARYYFMVKNSALRGLKLKYTDTTSERFVNFDLP